MSKELKWVVGIGALLLVLCLGIALSVGGGLVAQNSRSIATAVIAAQSTATPRRVAISDTYTPTPTLTATAVPPSATPTSAPTSTATLEPSPTASPQPTTTLTLALSEPERNLQNVESMDVPLSDARDLAERLQGKSDVPETEPAPAKPFQVGVRQTFWAFNDDQHNAFQVSATLRFVTDHLYFWIGDGVSYDPGDLQRLATTFETKIYPTDRAFFGSEWTPGIDNDPHLYALFVGGLGQYVGGYYSSKDEAPTQARSDSNAHEMFYINSDNVNLADEYVYSTMAHEFQHMIHWNRDRNESAWINEGFSVLAQLLNGYTIGGSDQDFIRTPDLQLNTWTSLPDAEPHYGESFLFLAYFLDRFGDQVTKAVVGEPQNGLEGIDAALTGQGVTDPQTGKPVMADDVFTDWTLANFIQNSSAGDGPFVYKRYSEAPQAKETRRVSGCPTDWTDAQVHQYGVEYIGITCPGNYTIQFKGSPAVELAPADPASGKYDFWSNQGDESDMTLTRQFDFSQASGPLTMTYKMWYDLEKDYDYVYLEASEDGQHWQILKTPSGSGDNSSGQNYGWGYTGNSGGWKTEQVNLSQYAGKQVQVRFEYITDPAVNGAGFLLDDVSLPAVNYSTDFESDDGGWEGKGFVRVENTLPQTFRVSIIQKGQPVTVRYVKLGKDNTASVPVKAGAGEVVLVVSGTTRVTTQQASFRYRLVK